jgi:hypothetical protein
MGLVRAMTAADETHGFWGVNPFTDGKLYYGTESDFTAAQSYTATDGWRMDGFSKADGNVIARGHAFKYSGGGWAHTDYDAVADNTGGGTLQAFLHGEFDAGQPLNGRLAVTGVWQSVLSDAQIEGLTTRLAEWLELSPTALWAFNQSSVATPVKDLTGNGADETSHLNTSVSTDEPPGFSYHLPRSSSMFLVAG